MAMMNEEEEFGMEKAFSQDMDPMEADGRSAVKDHPDFTFLDCDVLAKEDPRGNLPTWMQALPIEKDPKKWTILEVQLRPDRSWEVMKELIATLCISKGLVVAEETHSSVLFRKKVAQESLAHGMANTATFQNVFVRIGVVPSKLRVLDICYVVSGENSLLGGLMTNQRNPLAMENKIMKSSTYALDQLLGAIQSTINSQYLSLSHLFMATPENIPETVVEDAELDPGYVSDVKKMFNNEMKMNMRDLCIPLEEYAYEQEFACAMLIGLLDPFLKKYNIKLTESQASENASSTTEEETEYAEPDDHLPKKEPTNTPSVEESLPSESQKSPSIATLNRKVSNKCYGEVITDIVHKLWDELKVECDGKVQVKIAEKRKQVSSRVEAVQQLRMRAIKSIMDADSAELTSLKTTTPGNRSYHLQSLNMNDVLLYEGSCVINTIPAKLHVTYGALIYRTMIPLFVNTSIIPFEDIISVAQTSSFGIRVLAVELNPEKYAKGLTIAMGLEVDLLYQLLSELFAMHKHEIESRPPLPPLHQQLMEEDEAAMKKLLGDEEEEKEAEQGDDAATSSKTTNHP